MTREEIIDKLTKIIVSNKLGAELIKAVYHKDIELMKDLIERGANVNYSSRDLITPIHMAIQGGDIDLLKLLVNNGARISGIIWKSNGSVGIDRKTTNREIIDFIDEVMNGII